MTGRRFLRCARLGPSCPASVCARAPWPEALNSELSCLALASREALEALRKTLWPFSCTYSVYEVHLHIYFSDL